MAKKIFSLGRELPINAVENISLDSDRSLLDADIIVFEPNFNNFERDGFYKSWPLLTDQSSNRCRKAIKHWCRQLEECCVAGKTVLVYLSELEEVALCEDRQTLSKRDQNKVSDLVTISKNYYFLPIQWNALISCEGKEIKVCGDHKLIANYWREFGPYSRHRVYFDAESLTPVLATKSGDKPVGAEKVISNGAFILLPSFDYENSAFKETKIHYNTIKDEDGNEIIDSAWSELIWTNQGINIVSSLIRCLVEIDKALRSGRTVTPPPEWTQQPNYRMSEEATLESRIKATSEQIEALHAERDNLRNALENSGSLRRLLYETDHPLEEAILEALRLLGFKTETYKEGDSEFDAVFVSEEGRFLGEAEGKDNKAVNIDKFRQLITNLYEDSAREDVTEHAKGILFGNAFRLTPPAERGEFFTQKCSSSAKQYGTALVRTPDLFVVARYLKENDDEEFAKRCREALRDTAGQVVQFPPVPIEAVAEITDRGDLADVGSVTTP